MCQKETYFFLFHFFVCLILQLKANLNDYNIHFYILECFIDILIRLESIKFNQFN